ncbi:MAG: glycoside hydrolase family 15 protein, partial [Chloroflexota bacterium]
ARYRSVARDMRAGMDRYLWSAKHGRFLRMIVPRDDGTFEEDSTIDASLYGAFAFGAYPADDPRVMSTMKAVKDRLWVKAPSGGVARYENDYYHRVSDDIANVAGNPWFICTLWLAQHAIAKATTKAELDEALPILEWVAAHALPSGVLAEQVHPVTDAPLSVSPLTWSHATVVMCVVEYLEALERLSSCGNCGSSTFRIDALRNRVSTIARGEAP